jgi:hypothetical protein
VRTGVGLLAGTPHYMSPEQIRQEPVGPPADIYGLGAVLFKMLTGRLPFESQSLLEIVRMHLNDPAPRPSEHAHVSERMDAIVLACMDKDPARRPASMVELRELLRPIAEQLGPEAPTGDAPERAEMSPSAATAKSLQKLARSAVAVPKEAPQAKSRGAQGKSVGGVVVALLGLVALAGAGVVGLHPWARGHASSAAPVADGQRAASQSVVPRSEAPPVAAPPQPQRGVLSIESDPPGAQVFADHVPRGVAPLDLTVPIPVEIKLTMEGYRTIRRKIARPGPVHIRLVPDPGALPRPPEHDEEQKPPADPQAPE